MDEAGESNLLSCDDPRWKHLYYISEEISKSISRNESRDLEKLILDLDNALTSVHEAFPKEVDPALDPEGFAMRRFVKVLLRAFEILKEKHIER